MLLRHLFEDKWWDDTDVIRLYHGTSSALVPLIQQEGLMPPVKQLEEWAEDILELYIPREQWTEELVHKVHERCARTQYGRSGESGQVIFCMADFDGPAGYARSYAEHGGEIAKDVYETACMHVLGQTHNLDEVSWIEYQSLPRPFQPRFSGSKPVVVELLVPKDWCLFYLNLEHTKAGVQKAREEGRRWAIEQSLEQTYDEIFENKEVRIARTVPASMVVAVHDASEKQDLQESAQSLSIDDLPLSVKQDILDMLLVNCPPFEKWWMDHHGIMSFSQDYVSQCIFGTEDLENSKHEGYGDEQPFRVEAVTLPLTKLKGKESVSDHVVGQYAGMTSKAPPILVRKTSRGWKVVEGGHRYAAAVKRGDKSIRAYDVTAFFNFDYSELG